MKPRKVEFELGDHRIRLETGRIARQATGAVMAHMDDTSVLCTVTAATEAMPEQAFFPLTVDYQERMYAAGRIPGGFFRREGRPSEKETLTCRLIDRPIRPLFPKEFRNEVHVIATVMSVDRDVDPDIVSMIGTSAALAISGVPFAGPIGANRVGFQNNTYLLNPRLSTLEDSDLNMVVAGTESAVLMVESEAKELSEDQMLGAVLFAHQKMQVQIQAITQLAEVAGNEQWNYSPPETNSELQAKVEQSVGQELGDAYLETSKLDRLGKVRQLREKVVEDLSPNDEPIANEAEVLEYFSSLEKNIVRERILNGEARIDGRRKDEVRDLDIEVGLLPRTHGSALFQRGETQAIVAATLGVSRDAAMIDALSGNTRDYFLLHYNFPPYSVGEAGRLRGPARREIGHGRLARRAVEAVLPNQDDFPYTIRVVSEITESNGSSSMASVCGTSLALMDGGVPIKSAVAGVAMGLVKEDDRFAVLTDILGDEDHLGDMDFKVAGSAKGVTALQMDIKIEGITEEIMDVALAQAKEARMHILQAMQKVIDQPRSEISQFAPAIETVKVHPTKVRDVIGKGGATIRSIQEESGAEIEIDDDGVVKIYAESAESATIAKQMIASLTEEPEVGKVYRGEVKTIKDFGAFVNILPGKDGLVHISKIAQGRVERVSDYLKEGQEVDVVVLEIQQGGRVSLSMKDVNDAAN
ncbi:MAG: polyribonucleotide nucleotidyltransferase [Gammaproteobacteria bacterium]|nr:polyribonucleotide nucleotidyltransferase [Gammaproteobacteria bacterium]